MSLWRLVFSLCCLKFSCSCKWQNVLQKLPCKSVPLFFLYSTLCDEVLAHLFLALLTANGSGGGGGGGMKLVQTAIFQKSDWMLFCCLKCKFLSVFLCELLL